MTGTEAHLSHTGTEPHDTCGRVPNTQTRADPERVPYGRGGRGGRRGLRNPFGVGWFPVAAPGSKDPGLRYETPSGSEPQFMLAFASVSEAPDGVQPAPHNARAHRIRQSRVRCSPLLWVDRTEGATGVAWMVVAMVVSRGMLTNGFRAWIGAEIADSARFLGATVSVGGQSLSGRVRPSEHVHTEPHNDKALPQAAGQRALNSRVMVELAWRFRLAAGILLVATPCYLIRFCRKPPNEQRFPQSDQS